MSSTPSLRHHLLGHGLQCQMTAPGRLSQGNKDAVIQWYAAIITASGSFDNENMNEEDDEDEESEDLNDE